MTSLIFVRYKQTVRTVSNGDDEPNINTAHGTLICTVTGVICNINDKNIPYANKFKIQQRHYLRSLRSVTVVGPKHIIIHQRSGCHREAGRGRDAIRFAELLPRVPHMATNGRETTGAQERSVLSSSKNCRRRQRRRRSYNAASANNDANTKTNEK
jgi:hypothetical protein